MSGAAMMPDSIIPNSTIPNSELVSVLAAEFLTPAQVAAALNVSRKVLADWRLQRQGPPFLLRARGVVVYPAERFISYLRGRHQKDCREGLHRRESRLSRTMLRQDSGQRGSAATASLPRT